jgi:hypothetical protein
MDDRVEGPHVGREIAEQVAEDLAVNGEPVLLVDAQEFADLPGIEAIDPLLDDHPATSGIGARAAGRLDAVSLHNLIYRAECKKIKM